MRWHSLQSGDRFWELSESACHVSEVLGDDPLISSSYASFIGDALGIHDSTQVANVAATSVPCQDAVHTHTQAYVCIYIYIHMPIHGYTNTIHSIDKYSDRQTISSALSVHSIL